MEINVRRLSNRKIIAFGAGLGVFFTKEAKSLRWKQGDKVRVSVIDINDEGKTKRGILVEKI